MCASQWRYKCKVKYINFREIETLLPWYHHPTLKTSPTSNGKFQVGNEEQQSVHVLCFLHNVTHIWWHIISRQIILVTVAFLWTADMWSTDMWSTNMWSTHMWSVCLWSVCTSFLLSQSAVSASNNQCHTWMSQLHHLHLGQLGWDAQTALRNCPEMLSSLQITFSPPGGADWLQRSNYS